MQAITFIDSLTASTLLPQFRRTLHRRLNTILMRLLLADL
jgi:hypothetical protein